MAVPVTSQPYDYEHGSVWPCAPHHGEAGGDRHGARVRRDPDRRALGNGPPPLSLRVARADEVVHAEAHEEADQEREEDRQAR